MNRRRAARAACLALAVFSACGRAPGPPPSGGPAAATAPATPPATAPATLPHGDHNPHHDGVVMMKGDLHYEVVLDPTGREYRLYFSDAVREDLPAAYASAVTFTVRRPGEAEEPIGLRIDDTGESWIGSGRTVANPGKADVRVAFTVQSEPYWIDVPFAAPNEARPSNR